jgi:sugar lactone lactonase YvrE
MPEMQTLLNGLAFGESPRWHDERLWVADWGTQEILAVDLEGKREVIVKVSFPSFPMCFTGCQMDNSCSSHHAMGDRPRLQPSTCEKRLGDLCLKRGTAWSVGRSSLLSRNDRLPVAIQRLLTR